MKKCDLLHEIWDILRVWQHEKMTSSIKKREEELILVRVGATVVKKNYFFLKREINGMIMRIYFSRRFDQLGNISNKNLYCPKISRGKQILLITYSPQLGFTDQQIQCQWRLTSHFTDTSEKTWQLDKEKNRWPNYSCFHSKNIVL